MEADEAGTAPAVDESGLAIRLFNEAWALLDKEDRTPEEDLLLVHTAHASRLHWEAVGDDQRRAVGEWQVARVYSTLGRQEPALVHARRALELAQRPGVEAWVAASAYEGLARALLVSGDDQAARVARDQALAALSAVADAEDRDIVAADVDTLPFG